MGSLGVLYRMQLSNADVPVTRRCYFSIRWRTGGNYTRADGSLAGGSYVVHIYCLFWTVNGRGKWPLRAIAADVRSAYIIGKLVNFTGLVWVPRRV